MPHEPLKGLGGHLAGVAAAEPLAQGVHGQPHVGLLREPNHAAGNGGHAQVLTAPAGEPEHLLALPGEVLAGFPEHRVQGDPPALHRLDNLRRQNDPVMGQEPYRSAERVFWVVNNGPSHRGQAAARRLRQAYRNAMLVNTPVHARWLNQVEISFSIIQRKVLTLNDFASLAEVEERLRLYEELTNREPRPFAWKFDREKLPKFLERLQARRAAATQACPMPVGS